MIYPYYNLKLFPLQPWLARSSFLGYTLAVIPVKGAASMSVPSHLLSAVFSDESPLFRFPSEPDPGDSVSIRLRVARGSARRVILLMESLESILEMSMSCTGIHGQTASLGS